MSYSLVPPVRICDLSVYFGPRLASSIPWVRLARFARYVRGPRPKVDLPDPTPFLTLTLHSTGRHAHTIALEPALIRLARPFTNAWLFVILAAAYIIGLAFFSRAQSFLTPADSFIGCTATYWAANNGCGLDGEDCEPFSNTTFDFRCPAACSSTVLQNPRTVGDVQIEWVPLIVGGGDANRTYRGDSFICAAAIQAGLIGDSKGGCASLALTGKYTDYLPFSANGLDSIGFPTSFPLSFRFLNTTPLHHCDDLRTPALALNVIVTAMIFLFLRPKPVVAFWCLVCIGFWHVAFFSEPMAIPPPLDDAFAAFLPTLFLPFRFTMPVFWKAPIEAAVWYLPTFRTGVLTNLTMDKIPVDRLLASDLQRQPGAIIALIIIIVILVVLVLNQVRVIRKTGWLIYYLGWYVAGGLTTMVLALLPGLELRLHHYIIAMVLIPGTAFPTRLSAIYQGFLLGMFLNGVAAWGFDSILQTVADLQGDGASGSIVPSFTTNSTNYDASVSMHNQTIFWNPLPDSSTDWDGFSLIVDDVERYVGVALNFSLASLQMGLPHFFRLAYTDMGSDTTGDYTMPATLWPNGTWVDPLSGTST
ncbi:uncharacterized protein LAESUDRAFT_737299 [Laetiporus sulphureus 93-53]|uniref:LCCL domain-containing protein n=1 Tax=Laetiporus sulphureus 93-53 TaxID=1314785 RepID=A0A165DZZ8_9APHY|nr:uncharacterized protein LAESUDRAFT_737299 [Laetiporus sulphureus 93-53]KZT05982.1 hypothetical protein LAESUDRAFT_737299 [Laetiporus sulphureus 93-53]